MRTRGRRAVRADITMSRRSRSRSRRSRSRSAIAGRGLKNTAPLTVPNILRWQAQFPVFSLL